MVLYINSLFFNDVLDLRSGRSKWSLELTVFLFVLGCWAHVRRLSKIKPRYFIVGVIGIWLLLNDTEGQSPGLREKVIKDDFNSLIFIFQRFDHNQIELRRLCSH